MDGPQRLEQLVVNKLVPGPTGYRSIMLDDGHLHQPGFRVVMLVRGLDIDQVFEAAFVAAAGPISL